MVLSHCFNDCGHVHGKVHSLSKSLWPVQPITEQYRINYEFTKDLHGSLVMRRHDFTRITEVENRSAREKCT